MWAPSHGSRIFGPNSCMPNWEDVNISIGFELLIKDLAYRRKRRNRASYQLYVRPVETRLGPSHVRVYHVLILFYHVQVYYESVFCAACTDSIRFGHDVGENSVCMHIAGDGVLGGLNK